MGLRGKEVFMNYIKVKDAAERWGVSVRWVQTMCRRGEIQGAERWGNTWMIPDSTAYPYAEQAEQAEQAEHDGVERDMPMPRKSPFLDMTNLYSVPGTAEECAEALSDNPEAKALFEAQIAYSRGDIDKVYEHANYFLQKHSGFYAIVGGGMLLALCAMWRGDIDMWQKAKRHICEAPCKSDEDRDIILLALTSVDSAVYDVVNFPDWFKRGNFEILPPDSHPAAKVFYAKYLYASAYGVAAKHVTLEGIEGLSFMSMVPNSIEPLITQAVVDKTLVAEIYLRIICAIVYHNAGQKELAIYHLDKAIALALPDKLYGLLAEHRRQLDYLLDERLALVDPEALRHVKELHLSFKANWAKVSGIARNRYLAADLTTREREVSKLAAFGLSNQQIADRLHISLATVKQAIRMTMFKTGVENRAALATII